MATGRELLLRRVGPVGLRDLNDVDPSSYSDGQSPTWSDAEQKFLPGSGGGGGSYTDEQARDAVGAALTDSTTVTFSLNDGADQISAEIIDLVYINVAQAPYNISGDGTTDVTDVIQDALDACYAAGGGRVYLPEGVYRVSPPGAASGGCLLVKDYVTLEGAGMGKTIIKLADGVSNNATGIVRTPSGVQTKFMSLKNLTIHGNRDNSTADRIIATYCGVSPNVPISSITFSGGTATVTIASTSGFSNGQTIFITNAANPEYNGDQTITVASGTTLTFSCSGSPSNETISYAMLYPTSQATYDDQDILWENIETCYCSDYGNDPHEITTRLTQINCVSHHNGRDGFAIDFIQDSTYVAPIAYANDRHGINFITSSNNVTMVNPICKENGFVAADYGNGLVIQRGSDNIPFSRDNIILGGEYYGNKKAGILINLSDFNHIVGPSIHSNKLQGLKIDGGSYNTISAPKLSNNCQEADNTYDEISVSDYSYTLTSLTQSGGTATATINKTHSLRVGETITVTGATPSGYNVTTTVTAIPAPDQVQFAVDSGLSSPASLSSGKIYASYFITQYNNISDIAVIVTSAVRARYALKEDVSPISGGNNAYSISIIKGVASSNYSIGNSSSVIGGTIGNLGVSAQDYRRTLGVDFNANVINSATSVTLTNTPAPVQRVTFTAGSQSLTLPVMNATNSLLKGRKFEITNDGTNEFDILYQDGSTILSNLAPGKTVYLEVTSNGSANGSFNRIYPPSGKKSRSGTSYTVSQYDFNSLLTMSNSSGVSVITNIAASSFAQNFGFWLKNLGTGDVTFDPNSSETVNGASTLVLKQHASAYIYTDGTNWFTRERSNVVGTEVQAYDATLTALAAYNTNGFVVQTAADTFAGRQLTSANSKLEITNPAGTAGDPVLTSNAQFDVAVHAGANTNLTLTAMPAAATFLNGDYRSKTKLDLTKYTQCRIVVQMRGTAGSTGSKLIAKYRTTDSTTESDFSDIGTSEVSATIDANNVITASSWVDLAAGAKADVFVAVIGSGGNGTASPTVGSIHLQFR